LKTKFIYFILLIVLTLSIIFKPQINLQPKTNFKTFSQSIQKVHSLRLINPIDIFLEQELEKIEFYANTFQIDLNVLFNLLKTNHQSLNILNNQNNFDLILINYLFSLEESNKELFNNSIIPNKENSKYMISLIKYFTNIYQNVDFNIAASIANVESGYSAPSMLNVNNIFGGMTNGRLIRYKTIEYGILKYVKLLEEGYFKKGLTTIETIGYVYNPVFEEGIKKASPSWVQKVYMYINNFNDYQSINSLNDVLINKQKV